MNCPHCNKQINAITGFQEVEKFRKHLVKCNKNPDRKALPAFVDKDGFLQRSVNITTTSLKEALEQRANSGQ